MVVGGPGNVYQYNNVPVTIMQQHVNFKAFFNVPGRQKLQPPSFFPPYQARQCGPQQITAQFQPPPPGRTDQQPHQQQVPVNTKSNEPPTKRRGNLEASIRNLQNISLDIITGNNQSMTTTTVPGESPDKSPNQNQPPPPAEESAPPVYIIDTDDEQHIFTEEMMNKQQAKKDATQSTEKSTDMAEPNQTEHISKFVFFFV